MTGEAPLDTLKRLFTSGDDTGDADEPTYECRHCRAQFEHQHPVCPDCGGRSIEQADWQHSAGQQSRIEITSHNYADQNSTWKQATEQESTATRVFEFLRSNRSEAYTANELVEELGPDEPVSESVVAYYRAILEMLADSDRIEKRRVLDATVAGQEGTPPYYRAVPDESCSSETAATAEEWITPSEEVEEREGTPSDLDFDLDLEQPVSVSIEGSNTPIPVRVEDSYPRPDAPEAATPFFVRWYRWYRRQLGDRR